MPRQSPHLFVREEKFLPITEDGLIPNIWSRLDVFEIPIQVVDRIIAKQKRIFYFRFSSVIVSAFFAIHIFLQNLKQICRFLQNEVVKYEYCCVKKFNLILSC